MKHITIITGYYYPEDTAIALYNTQMVDYLRNKGYVINVITGFPCYPQWEIRERYKKKPFFLSEIIMGTKVYRYKQYVPSKPNFFKRLLLLIDFTIGSFFNLFKIRNCDIVICIVPHTTTIILGFVLRIIKNAKIWIHVQDFEFDAARETGVYNKQSILKDFIFKMLFKMESFLLSRANVNSTISHNMLAKLKLKSSANCFYFPNWVDVSQQLSKNNFYNHQYIKSNRYKILYSGNIGDKQDWEFFYLFALELVNCEVDIYVVGDGSKKEWLVKKTQKLENVYCFPPVPYCELQNLLISADLHILFQKASVIDSVMPSKLLGMMLSGKPSLVCGSPNSEVKEVLNESKGGFYVEYNDVRECVTIVKKLIDSPESGNLIGQRAAEYVKKYFSSEEVLGKFVNKLNLI